MDKEIKRKIISSILLKNNNSYHRLFQVEGDKKNDASLYIVQLNDVEDFSNFNEDNYRNYCLQQTVHSRMDKDGLVETHFKRNQSRFAKSRCLPLDKLHYVRDYSMPEKANINKYPIKNLDNNDILIKSRYEYLSEYRFIFYKGENLLSKHVSTHNLYILQKEQILTNNTAGHMFALAIELPKLIKIQSSN